LVQQIKAVLDATRQLLGRFKTTDEKTFQTK